MSRDAPSRRDSPEIRYAQCWEDADILLEALNVGDDSVCLSIASGGDNTLSLLSRAPRRVIAVDRSPAQLACLALKVEAFRRLDYDEVLELTGSAPSARRCELYAKCRPGLAAEIRAFWDRRRHLVARGIGDAGKFEGYFRIFRRLVMPMVHGKEKIAALLRGGAREERARFYDREWDTWRWRAMFRLFFSRAVMARLGRDPESFRYVKGDVAEGILARTRDALVELDPRENPYLQWILTGQHGAALPHALREEQFLSIRRSLERLEVRNLSLEECLDTLDDGSVDAFNLSDVFEYVPQRHCNAVLEKIARKGRRGARLAYWNMRVERRRPESMAHLLRSLEELGAELFRRDKAFFYRAFVVEEVL